jgi:hypothetical protein
LTALGASLVPKFECDSSATRGEIPRRRSSSAALMAISAISSAFGSTLTCVSTSAIWRPGSIKMFIAA